jgi:hypothetical protein
MTVRFVLTTILFVAAGSVTPLWAQPGKPKPMSSWPGTATFRCQTLDAAPCTGDGADDRIIGDQSTYDGLGTPEGGQGAHLRSGYEMWLGLRNGLTVFLKFGGQAANAPCLADGNCRFPTAIPSGNALLDSGYAEIQTNVINQSDESDSSPTLLSIPVGHTWMARLNISFNDAVTGMLWNFNFNKNRRPLDADNINITREASCTWRVWSGKKSADGLSWEVAPLRAELSAYGQSGKGKAFRTFEGFYTTPVEFTFDVPNCPAS